jgi:hypothetical protein
MTPTRTIPATWTPEATTRVAELGFQAQVELMIEYARENLPGLTRIEVVLNDRYDMGGEPGVAIEAYSRQFDSAGARISSDLVKWEVSEFPSEVLEHLLINFLPEWPDAG